VRWFDLYEAIKAGGHRLMLSIADLGWGSVVGNTLDHGVTYMPYGVDMGMQCGMEVVLANGEVMRTGMGAMPNNRSWHLYKRGLGPTPDQLFMQSNSDRHQDGRLADALPEVYMPLWLRVWRDDDLAEVVDILRTLMLDGTIRMVPQLMNTILLGSVLSSREQWWTGEGPMPQEAIERMARELEIGRWCMRFALYGDEAVVDHRFEKIKRAFSRIDGADVWGSKCAPEDIPTLAHPAERIQGGVPDLEWNNMTSWYGGEEGGHIGFSPIAPLVGRDAVALRDLLRAWCRTPAWTTSSACSRSTRAASPHHDGDLRHQGRGAGAQRLRGLAATGRRGRQARLRRVPGAPRLHDLAADQYSFNNHSYLRFCETIKDALDPAGILSPGKQGIWPASMRHGRV